MLEIRIKSHNIKNLLELKPIENLLVSFTFSPQEVIARYELKTSSLEYRIEAAKKLQEKWYSLGIRFDPIINIGIRGLRYNKGLRKRVLAERKTALFSMNL